MRLIWLALAAIVTAATAGAAVAQTAPQVAPDPAKGHTYATQFCAQCHAVEAGATASPNAQAPTFVSAANTPGMTAMALRVFLSDMHDKMPSLIVPPANLADVVAYILTLQKH